MPAQVDFSGNRIERWVNSGSFRSPPAYILHLPNVHERQYEVFLPLASANSRDAWEMENLLVPRDTEYSFNIAFGFGYTRGRMLISADEFGLIRFHWGLYAVDERILPPCEYQSVFYHTNDPSSWIINILFFLISFSTSISFLVLL